MSTLGEIARLAGVSTATVSNVVRGKGSVGAGTAERVRAVARQLGYRPNLVARALAEGRAPTIALFFTDILNPYYPQFAHAAEQAARRRGHFLLVCNAAAQGGVLDTAYIRAVAGRLAGGLILLGSDTGGADLLAMLPDDVPTVFSTWENASDYPTTPCVNVDFVRAGELAAEHLLSLGHCRIGLLVGGRNGVVYQTARLAGASRVLRDAGSWPHPDRLAVSEDSIAGGRKAACLLLRAAPELTAILATNDLLAIGALQAASELGVPVPTNLSVIGITDIWMAAQMRPALTTIDIGPATLASGAVDLLLDLIHDPAAVPPDRLRVMTTPRLIRRDSTAPPRPQT
ncbi:LacI family DNA-binding transcriptional regulator [Lichenicoccus sp.]|uniref:LacI family DNA-binding transcriptional regulator n=1 Tax=Lichenicoccus sp. TaxID=2781899 RepID=UPI003D10EE55